VVDLKFLQLSFLVSAAAATVIKANGMDPG